MSEGWEGFTQRDAQRNPECLNESSGEGCNSDINGDTGDSQQGRESGLIRSSVCALNLSGYSQDSSALCKQPRSKYSWDLEEKIVLQAVFTQLNLSLCFIPSWDSMAGTGQAQEKLCWFGRRRHGEWEWDEKRAEGNVSWLAVWFISQTAKSGRLWNPHCSNHLNINWIKALKKILQNVD